MIDVAKITSNNEKELPDAFLRRCFFHYIRFPDHDTMRDIVDVHYPGLKKDLLEEALKAFYDLRDVPGLKKKPSTSELLDWIKLLVAEQFDVQALLDRLEVGERELDTRSRDGSRRGGGSRGRAWTGVARREHDGLVKVGRLRAYGAAAEHAAEIMCEVLQDSVGRHRQIRCL